MGIPLYLAMTALELQNCSRLPDHIAWMACHFSPYGTGLCNIPSSLPPKSMIILNDRTPIYGHDPQLITDQLIELKEKLNPDCFLLDFQRSDSQETARLTQTLVEKLPCPVGVSDLYATDLPCPIFLSPPMITTPLVEHISKWQGREIWLESALDDMDIIVTEQGCVQSFTDTKQEDATEFICAELYCHYRTEIYDGGVNFHLSRQKDDLSSLLSEAESLGVTTAVGLYQQLK